MLETLFPKAVVHYRSLPLLGPIAEDFVRWLAARGYREKTLRVMVRPFTRIDRRLCQKGIEALTEVDAAILGRCWEAFHRRAHNSAAVVRALGQYLAFQGLAQARLPDPPTPAEQLATEYVHYLEKARGFAPSTISNHARSASQFLEHVGHDGDPARLGILRGTDIEAFVRARGQQLRRTSLSLRRLSE